MTEAGRRTRLFAALVAVTVLLGACGTGSAPTPVGDAPIDAQVMLRLLTVGDIGAAGGDTGGLDARVEDLRALAAAVDPGQVAGIRTWYGLLFQTADRGLGLTLTVVDFESEQRAHAQLDIVESGPAFAAMGAPIGDRSAVAGAGDGVGGAIAFVSAQRLVTLHSITGAAEDAPVDEAQLEELARLVEGRL